MADRIAIAHGVSTTTLSNLIFSESRWNPEATSTTKDRGITQISSIHHPEVTDECAFNPECALDWTARRIADGYGYEWVSMNCYLAVKLKIKNLPKMAEIVPNTELATSTIAIFSYRNVKHIALVESVKKDSFVVWESNYRPGLIGRREVKINDPALQGFYEVIRR